MAGCGTRFELPDGLVLVRPGSKFDATDKFVLERLRPTIQNEVDLMYLSRQLNLHQCVTNDFWNTVVSLYNLSNSWAWDYLFDNMEYHCPLSSFIHELTVSGYHRLADKCVEILLELKGLGSIIGVNRQIIANRRVVHSFFKNLKRMVHDAQFVNPRTALRQLADSFLERLSSEQNEQERLLLADKYVAILGAEIDAHAITFDGELPNNNLFDKMKSVCPNTRNTAITDVIYYGRLANANAISGKFKSGEEMLKMARLRAFNTGPCLEIANMYYCIVYVRLWEFEKRPSQDLLLSLMEAAKDGLYCLEYEDEDIRRLWRRMFLLRMTFCHLGIGNRANIIHSWNVQPENVMTAKRLLAEVDTLKDKIETRREMFYCVARARLCEVEKDFLLASHYVHLAEQHAVDGRFEELKFIVNYVEYVNNLCDGRRIEHSCELVELLPSPSPKSQTTPSVTTGDGNLYKTADDNIHQTQCRNRNGHVDEEIRPDTRPKTIVSSVGMEEISSWSQHELNYACRPYGSQVYQKISEREDQDVGATCHSGSCSASTTEMNYLCRPYEVRELQRASAYGQSLECSDENKFRTCKTYPRNYVFQGEIIFAPEDRECPEGLPSISSLESDNLFGYGEKDLTDIVCCEDDACSDILFGHGIESIQTSGEEFGGRNSQIGELASQSNQDLQRSDPEGMSQGM